MHSEKVRSQPHDPEGEPNSESYRGGGDVIAKGGGDIIAKGGGDVIAKESAPQPGLAEHMEETIEGETVRTPLESDRL